MRKIGFAFSVFMLFGIAGEKAATLTAPERAVINDNRTAAGMLQNGVLTIRLETREAVWHPDGDKDTGVTVYVFGEEGGPALNPGPMMRVPEGTEIRATIRNSLPTRIVVHGLYERLAATTARDDTMHIAAGAVREVRFNPGVAGTYFYWASTTDAPTIARTSAESQLGGALIVDPRNTSAPPRDRVFFISSWGDAPTGAQSLVGRIAINGKSWPHTERLTYTSGDTIRWRVINGNAPVHPMHLHGFYFAVNSRGNERVDTTYSTASAPHLAVTERLVPGRTMSLTWVPDRSGNWIFHCHDNVHLNHGGPLPGASPAPAQHHVENHALEMMAGPVMGVYVRPRGAEATSTAVRRRLRLIARVDSGGSEAEPAFGYVLQDGSTQLPSRGRLLPGPVIVLRRGEPVSIMVVNELPEPTAVHWHGIELESYFDGVAGFGGAPGRISPPVAARDSFEARFTPPRAGTFIYHAHLDEVRQQQAGLSGALLVIEPGTTHDPETDMPLLITVPRQAILGDFVLLNGSVSPPLKEMRVGTRYRLRIINVHTYRPSMIASLRAVGGGSVQWRPVAKDGADVPAERAVLRPASQQLGNGETYDFEFVPTAAGDLRFDVNGAGGALLATMPIRVRQ